MVRAEGGRLQQGAASGMAVRGVRAQEEEEIIIQTTGTLALVQTIWRGGASANAGPPRASLQGAFHHIQVVIFLFKARLQCSDPQWFSLQNISLSNLLSNQQWSNCKMEQWSDFGMGQILVDRACTFECRLR